VTTAGQTVGTTTRVEETALRDLDRDTRRIVARVKEGVAKDYVRHRVDAAAVDADVLAIRTEVAALIMVDGVIREIEDTATKWVNEQFTKFAVEIKNTTGATRDAYRKVQEQISKPEKTTIELTDKLRAPTKDSNREDAEDLPTFDGHLYADAKGKFPAKLNEWETEVVKKEIKRPSFVSWYRNPQRATPSSLRIAYQNDADTWGSLQIDFLVISRQTDGSFGASIVDPHGSHLADAKAKLRGLADYADLFGDQYVRIESVARLTDGRLRVLELKDEKVRIAVRAFEGGSITALYESNNARDYA